MRVQCSLIITDDEVYDVIQDLKEQKELNPLLARLITSYVKGSDEFRRTVNSGVDYVSQEQVSYDDEYRRIREDIMTMDIMLEDAANLFSDSKSTFADYMEQAEDAGIIRNEHNEESQTTSPKLLEHKKVFREEEDGNTDAVDIKFIAEQLRDVSDKVSILSKDVQQLKDMGVLKESSKTEEENDLADLGVSTQEKSVEPDTPDEPEFPTEEPEDDFDVDIPVLEDDIDEEPEFIQEEEPEPVEDVPVAGEAADDMGSLLSSLF